MGRGVAEGLLGVKAVVSAIDERVEEGLDAVGELVGEEVDSVTGGGSQEVGVPVCKPAEDEEERQELPGVEEYPEYVLPLPQGLMSIVEDVIQVNEDAGAEGYEGGEGGGGGYAYPGGYGYGDGDMGDWVQEGSYL